MLVEVPNILVRVSDWEKKIALKVALSAMIYHLHIITYFHAGLSDIATHDPAHTFESVLKAYL